MSNIANNGHPLRNTARTKCHNQVLKSLLETLRSKQVKLCCSGLMFLPSFFFSLSSLQLCESLEDLLNVNSELRTDGQAMWNLMGGILGQVLANVK